MPLVVRRVSVTVLGAPVYAFDHPCDHAGCKRRGMFGFGVKLRKRKGGKWFCEEHRGDGAEIEPDRLLDIQAEAALADRSIPAGDGAPSLFGAGA